MILSGSSLEHIGDLLSFPVPLIIFHFSFVNRWWPSKVVHPVNLPLNIEALPHQVRLCCVLSQQMFQDGEFPIQFLGSGEYYWINHGRVFLYDEGDCEKVPSLGNKSMDKAFMRGLAEAEVLWKELATSRREREEKGKGGGKGRPPHYVKIKTNKVVGDCSEFTVSAEGQECDCNPHKENPCGEESNCINRMLMYECDPHVCQAAKLGKCLNQRFAKRQYPALQVNENDTLFCKSI